MVWMVLLSQSRWTHGRSLLTFCNHTFLPCLHWWKGGGEVIYTAEIERQRTVKCIWRTWFLRAGKRMLDYIKWEQLGKCSHLPEVVALLLDLEGNLVYSRRNHWALNCLPFHQHDVVHISLSRKRPWLLLPAEYAGLIINWIRVTWPKPINYQMFWPYSQ